MSTARTPSLPREKFVQSFQANFGVGREIAEAKADELYGAQDPKQIERDARILEKAEQTEITRLFRRHGFTVRSTSQSRPSKIAIGFYDLLVTHKTKPIAFFFDCKRQVGSVWSEAQQEFAADLSRCGWSCFHGDRFEAQRVLESLGFEVIR